MVGERMDEDVFRAADFPLACMSWGPHFPCFEAAFISALEILSLRCLSDTGMEMFTRWRWTPETLQSGKVDLRVIDQQHTGDSGS